MKKPLDCAILKLFTKIEEASPGDVLEMLKSDYGNMRPFTKKGVSDVLMTAVVNGILEEAHYELDKNDDLIIYYRANEEGRAIINRYLPD